MPQTLPGPAYPKPPAHVAPIVDVPRFYAGAELALRFLLRFGGAGLNLPADPRGRSQAEALIGADRLRRLGEALGLRLQVPMANAWVCAALDAEGKSLAEIARP